MNFLFWFLAKYAKKYAKHAKDYSLFTTRRMLSFNNLLLKLINKPNFIPDNLKYVNVWAKCTGAKASIDLTSIITLSL